ncbi:MAG: class I tRNA ligase family protein, partial [Fusobacterium necrophorum]|nr:class I tRNA ligase family protein [Fusobacterium necrophorum]
GADIIFFWVARMIMFGLYEMKDIPFRNVFFHGIVRDDLGRKMSKSLGNSPDPLDLIDQYGADAIRFSMIYNTSQGQDVRFSEKLLEMGRNFANKIWNASRFVMMNLEDFDINTFDEKEVKYELVDEWILSRLQKTAKAVEARLSNFQLDEAAKAVYEFLRGDFCDWYVEIAKIRLYNLEDVQSKRTAQYVLWSMLEAGLRLLHPFMPYISEEIWQSIKKENVGETIVLAEYPKFEAEKYHQDLEEDFAYIQEVISSLRNIRAEMGISPAKEAKVIIRSEDDRELKILERNKAFLQQLAKISDLSYGKEMEKPADSAFRVARNSVVYMILADLIDKEAEVKKIQDQIAKVQKDLDKVNAKLANEKFVSKAPTEILEREKRIQKEYQDKMYKLVENLKNFMI